MKLIPAQELFDQAREYLSGTKMDGTPCEKNLDKSESLLNEILNHNLGNYLVLHMLASLHLERGHFGLSVQIFSQVTQIKPDFAEAWNNMALGFKGINNWAKALACTKKAAQLSPNPVFLCNVAGAMMNRNMPEQALEYSDKALAADPEYIKAKWHKALALLEMRRWEDAWDWHESRLIPGASNENVAERNYHGDDKTPVWDGVSKGTVVIHGEQGIGDEIMFATCIPDAMKTGANFIFEPSPRLETLFQRSFPGLPVYGTNDTDGRRWIAERGNPDSKIALGSLPKFFRRSAKDFPGTPFLKPDPTLKSWWGDKLKALGPKLRVGIAWQGGVDQTRQDARSFHPVELAPLFANDCNWISLQYDFTAKENVEDVRRQLGVKIHHWPKAVEQKDPETGQASNIDELVALMSNLDLVISVCQTTIHVAGALGIPCLCLTPSEPSWRYGAGDATDMPWYRSVELIRQQKGSRDWAPVIQEASNRLRSLQQRKTA